jgi:hypothetical protein
MTTKQLSAVFGVQFLRKRRVDPMGNSFQGELLAN